MGAAAEMLKTTEAAVVSRVALRDVNRVIDEGILPAGLFTLERGRHVLPAACALISFYFESARQLTSEERLFTMKLVEPRIRRWKAHARPSGTGEDWTVRHEFLTVDLASFVNGTAERLDQLAAARNMVEATSHILGGTLVIRGTRIPVHDVAAQVAAGVPVEQLLEDYPSLNASKIELAILYAEAIPMRGRPRAGSELPKGAVIITDRRVARRTAG